MPEASVPLEVLQRQQEAAKREQKEKAEARTKNGNAHHHEHYPFWFGGSASCFAACVTHPLDLIKVRLQTQSSDPTSSTARRSALQTALSIIRNDGPLALYAGLSASILRQATYSTTRFGVYESLKEHFSPENAPPPSVGTLIALSSLSGLLGGIAGNPADVLNVRMQHDAALPASERRNYRHALDGLVKMIRHEGPASLFRGVWPNSLRGLLMTASQLASYDTFKRLLITNASLDPEKVSTHFAASTLSGLLATTVCSPVDVIKTRVMSAKEKRGTVGLVVDIFRREGLSWCFRGWVPSFVRLGPHTVATFLFLEQHKKLYRRYVLGRGVDA
ncbi:MAG: Mitochondrial dicarboxylate transporter [Chrysothrix sp. TS-e1954]|nr:MAG: Mitochondrial dicarboxylate transporter [Chrysothrix sp. TS-e1954]